MKRIREIWILFNLVVATAICGTLTIVTAFLDRSKRHIGWWPRTWARWILWSTGLTVIAQGRRYLEKGTQYIYMSNHTSALDIPLALAVLPGTVVFMAKKELFRIFFFGWSLKGMGSIPVDRSNRTQARLSVDRALESLDKKAISIILYPEGTRTRDGNLLPFKTGVFHLALRSRLDLVPIAVQGAFEALPPRSLSLTHTPIRVTIGEPIETKDLTDKDRGSLLEKARESIQALLDATQ